MTDYWVVERDAGQWAVRREGAARDTEVLKTQAAAVDRARELLRSSGGGELIIQGRDGRIRKRDTVPPGHDPHPPKG
jgi:hypothetical protein